MDYVKQFFYIYLTFIKPSMNRKLLFSALLILFSVNLFSQNTETIGINTGIEISEQDSLKLEKIVNLAYKHLASDNDSLYYTSQQALELANQLNHNYGKINAYFLLGYYYYYNENRYYNAINYFDKATKLLIEENDSLNLIDAYLSISNCYYSLAEYNEALEFSHLVLSYSSILDYKSGIADAYLTLGIIQGSKNNHTEAIEYYELAAEIYQELNDSIGIGLSFNNVGDSYLQLTEFQKAKEYFELSYNYYDSEDNKNEIAGTHHNLGIVYGKLGETDKAREYFKNAEANYLQTQGRYELAELYKDIAVFYADIKNYHKAIEYGEKAFNHSMDIGAKLITKIVSEDLSNYYAQLKNYAKAFEKHQVYKKMSDSLIDEEKSRQFMEIESKYQISEKEKEILFQKEIVVQREKQLKTTKLLLILITFMLLLAITFGINWFISRRKLKLKNIEIEAQKKELQELNHTKDKLFSIIGHDLRNSIGAVYNFIQILLDVPDYSDTESIKDILSALEKSFGSTYNLLENLLYWAKTQQNRIRLFFEKQEINGLIEDNISLFQAAAASKEIQLNNILENKLEAVFDKNSINLVLRNLISNAIKFTPNNGNINIGAVQKENYLEVFVSDSGKGISEEIMKKIFNDHFFYSSPGTLEESGSGLGLKLCKEFVDRNNGEISVRSVVNEGSKFMFTIPLKAKPESLNK